MSLKTESAPLALIIYYSFSRQTCRLVEKFTEGLEKKGVNCVTERIYPEKPPAFPLNSIPATIKMMLATFFRVRIPIKPLSDRAFQHYDLVIIAGPTWSFNPSGPILAFLDRDSKNIFSGRPVLPLISCRKYWRTNAWYLKKRIIKSGGIPEQPIHYQHPVPDPWNLVGVFLTIAGKSPRKIPVMKKYYPRYGHTTRQLEQAVKDGEKIGAFLLKNQK
jgi:flavodoxin